VPVVIETGRRFPATCAPRWVKPGRDRKSRGRPWEKEALRFEGGEKRHLEGVALIFKREKSR